LARAEISHYASYKKSAKVIDSDIPDLSFILHPRVTSGEPVDPVFSFVKICPLGNSTCDCRYLEYYDPPTVIYLTRQIICNQKLDFKLWHWS